MDKICTICGTRKPLEDFSKDKRQKLGHRPECKTCEHLRPSYLLKALRFRLKHHPRWYGSIKSLLTKEDVLNMSRRCYFCKNIIADGTSLHRLNHLKDYTIENTVMVHKTCHAKYGEHNKKSRTRVELFAG